MNRIFDTVDTPVYILEEERLRRNLSLIRSVGDRADAEIILAFKAYALWKTFPIFREYIHATTASSLYEARLAFEEFGTKAHTFSPAYTESEIDAIAACSSHLTFNSLTQYERYASRALARNPRLLLGLRINPEYSEVGTLIYNPCAPGSRFGITADKLPATLPESISGLHCHCLCESGADVLERTLAKIEERFGRWLSQVSWFNLGGGHLMTRSDYDVERLVSLVRGLHQRYPNLRIILEPGSAFAWRTGVLVAQVEDITEDKGIRTAVLNVSFTCHMPDCLEMPYWPAVAGAKTLERYDAMPDEAKAQLKNVYRLGGNSCLAGDYMSAWAFPEELKIGDRIVFEDMLHYTTVKTNMFNGITHPAIALLRVDGTLEMLRQYDYADYKSRMD
ncbi:MAG: carboxynorspermidine decarboxylase [Prevotella sp.]|nr:carboxynorspermidine decarboxylase [Prevotella sp.]